jgi:type IX secretion system PorP/SprF family membrane protein
MSEIKKLFIILFLTFSFNVSDGQQTPLNPISTWVFTPYIYNPGMVGSKDYLSIDLNSAFQGNSNSQIISTNTRFSKVKTGYFASRRIFEFKNVGIGGSVFHDFKGNSHNIGITVAGSYQIPLNKRKLSFLSFGASVKGIYNTLDTGSTELGKLFQKTFYPNLDMGIYYFDTKFFTGLSTTNLFGSPKNTDTPGKSKIPVARQYFFTVGYKFLLYRSMDIVLEPSLLVNSYDSTFNLIIRNIDPILKLYVENFCIGTYLFSNGKTSFFTQFRYPRFYVGAFFELPRKTAYFKGSPIVQFTVGINILSNKSKRSNRSHW